MSEWILVFFAGLLGGAMNAVAGGGSFVTLPALVAAGVPSLNANATSTVALVPSALATAYAYRKDYQGFEGVSMKTMAVVSVLGGGVGAVLLKMTSQRMFDNLFPFLLLFGVVVFAFGRTIGDWLRQRVTIHPQAMPVAQFVLGIYGGYFGGAVGVMMLATWSVLTKAAINTLQASRNLLNAAMNATASALFIAFGLVSWPQMAALLVGATIGGYSAGHLSRGLDPKKARAMIVALQCVIVALVFWKKFG